MMTSKVIWILAVCGPVLIACQSRGETYHGQTARSDGYGARSEQYQSQYNSDPSLYQQQAYPNPPYSSLVPEYYAPAPQYYSQPNSQSSYVQTSSYIQQSPQNYNQPAYTRPNPIAPIPQNRPPPRPLSIPPKFKPNFDTQPKPISNLDSRFGPEQSTLQQDEFTQRATAKPKGPRKPVVVAKPPVFSPTRFDDRDSIAVTKKLSFNEQLSESMEKFALEMLLHMNLHLTDQNFMMSPFSVYHLLVLIAEGSRGNSYNEINQKLNFFNITATRDFQQYLNVALNQNSADVVLKKFALLITDQARPVSKEYENTVEKVYDADVVPVNFLDPDNTAKEINKIVSNYTQGLIKDTVKRDDLFKAQLILLSGLFFQGKWMNVFNQSFTKQEPFFDTNGKQIGNVNMMFQRGPIAYSAVADLGCHILELPYAQKPYDNTGASSATGTSLSMILVLPRKGLALDDAIENVYKYGMTNIYRELYNSKVEYEDDEVEVHLPRFEIETSLDLKDILQEMGIKDIFDQSRADLSNINNRYFVSSMIHKTKISVDEKGTTAAAVTTSIFANKATPPKFHANKPFLYFIVDKVTKMILFSGQYTSPELY